MGVREGIDPTQLTEAGWGVIFPGYPAAEPERRRAMAAVREALQPLLDWRRQQAGYKMKELELRASAETKNTFLARYGAGPGPADPDKAPYYLLIVGSPTDIPYRFQYTLDVQYAVGRIHFDKLDDYASYAAGVVAAEQRSAAPPRRAVSFSVQNRDDAATALASTKLMAGLVESVAQAGGAWQVETVYGGDASKERLAKILAAPEGPSLLVAAGHGMTFPSGDARQLSDQGALLCADWPGPASWRQPVPRPFYFSGDDLDADARLSGLIAFLFASYSAGTPDLDEFATQAFKQRLAIAPHPFVANLAKRMLAHPGGGALAVIGLLGRAWGFSFLSSEAEQQRAVYAAFLDRLLKGAPVGLAVENVNERWAELTSVLDSELEELAFGKKVDAFRLASIWTMNNDARCMAIVGDPAVRLA